MKCKISCRSVVENPICQVIVKKEIELKKKTNIIRVRLLSIKNTGIELIVMVIRNTLEHRLRTSLENRDREMPQYFFEKYSIINAPIKE